MKLLSKIWLLVKANKLEVAIVVGLLIIVGLVHGINMFHFPYFEDDEGTYMSQAWSLATFGKLAPYTYWYDHAPAGWMLIALWLKLTGGPFTFGFSINSGRVLMLILHIFSALFVYLIGRKLTGSKVMASMATLLFSLSPLTLALQRRVLLDNIMVFWLLASIVVILYARNRLSRYVLSGVLFAIAALSKESALVFLPVMIYLAAVYSDRYNRKQAIAGWILSSFAVISLYPIMALIKGEFFPTGTFLGGTKPHVSLLGTLMYQAGRKAGGFFGSFVYNYNLWLKLDPLTTIGGSIVTASTVIAGIWSKPARIVGLLALAYWLFLLRGGADIDFYDIPLAPLLGLATAYLVWATGSMMKQWKPLKLVPYLMYSAIVVYMWTGYDRQEFAKILVSDQTSAQVEAVNWMLSQNAPGRDYSIDMYGYIDLHAKNHNNFAHADYYWKVDEDPGISSKVLHGNYKNIDYIAATKQLAVDAQLSNLTLNEKALQNSTEVVSFNDPGGWWVTIYRVNK